ncbi:LuxR C-terminal-related transcriptional regulator [Niabella hirudinis]|uniref:LuxR C-terminal-related transcriptional regulator n=1 Tax=Niabella hirudinis TaxID=1285929 RepID=UPI003EBD4B8F
MKEQDHHFYLTAKKFWKTVVNKETVPNLEQLQQQVEHYKRLLSIFHAGNYYYQVFNIYTSCFDLVSPEVKNVLGYEPREYEVGFLMSIIHPDDKPYVLNFEYKIVEFFKTLSFEKVSRYKVQYDFRIRKKNGDYMRTLHQAVQVDYDRENYYRTLSLETDITHIKPHGEPCFSLIGLDGEPSYYNIKDKHFTKSFDLFTRREREVLKGIVEGKTSRQLAEELCISIHTLHTHRKNILGKAKTKTPLELVKKTLGEGWV